MNSHTDSPQSSPAEHQTPPVYETAAHPQQPQYWPGYYQPPFQGVNPQGQVPYGQVNMHEQTAMPNEQADPSHGQAIDIPPSQDIPEVKAHEGPLPDPIFLDTSSFIVCPVCRYRGGTMLKKERGVCSWVACLVTLGSGFCLECFMDVVHVCPQCRSVVGRYQRL